MDLNHLAYLSRLAATKAGDLALRMRSTATITARRGKDFTTDADSASENAIREILLGNAGNISFYGEEAKGDLPKIGRVWIVDPIDGTHNYRKECGNFSISIALVENGAPIIGTVYFPQNDKLYQGYDGRASEHPSISGFAVNAETDLAESTVWTDWTKTKPVEYSLSMLERLWDCSRYPTIALCATHGLMMVATGKLEGYIHPAPAIEDHAAAGLLVQLAGGTVTDMHGNPWTPFSESIVATNGKIHEALLNAINDII